MATADELMGSLVVVGITYATEGAQERTHQVAGVVERIDDVIEIRQSDGSTFSLPPAPEAFERAEPGVYTLRSTGVQIEGPAFMASFRVS